MKIIKRALLAFALILGLVLGSALPAPAADNAWSWSTCNSTVLWYGIPGSGAWYANTTTPDKYYWLDGIWHQAYMVQGYECGALGAPLGGSIVLGAAGTVIDQVHQHAVYPRGTTAKHIHFTNGCLLQYHNNVSGTDWAEVRRPCPYST